MRGRVAGTVLMLVVCAACVSPDREDPGTGHQERARNGSEGPSAGRTRTAGGVAGASLRLEGEKHFGHVRQLTFGGENAEAYWDPAGERLILQSTRDDLECDQIFVARADGGESTMVSTGRGRTTCAYFLPRDRRIVYSSTHEASDACPPRPDYSRGYVWPLYPEYELYTAREDGSDVRRLTRAPGYDAEATVSPDGSRIVFTSMRDGDPEIYSMSVDGSNVRRLTNRPGYDGGPFFSPDGERIVFRAHHPTGEALEEFRGLLGMNLIRPTALEIHVMDADGSNPRQVTRLGGANFCPYFHPDGRRIIFASNHENPRDRNFDIFLVGDDGSNLVKVTTSEVFDGFPMFDREGRRLAFSSNRNASEKGETNVFVAEWIE